MADTSISAFPWLCSTVNSYHDACYSSNGNMVSDEDAAEADIATEDAFGKFGMKLQYYAVSMNLNRDKLYGEDQLQYILRSWYFNGYTNAIPPNVRSYQLQGIWGEDVFTLYASIPAFNYYSKYGGPEKNTPDVYDVWEPKIGDIIYMPYNETFYDIRDVKYYEEAFGLNKHTYTFTCKVYKDDKYTISANDTLPPSDPIWEVATSALSADKNFNDYLSINTKLKEHPNANMDDVLYKPKVEIEQQTRIDPFGGW